MTRVRSLTVAVVALLVAGSALAPGAAAEEGPSVGDAVPSAGCGVSDVGPGAEQVFLTAGDVERWYNRRVPTAHDGTEPVPVVFDYHGLAEGAVIHENHSQFTPKGEAEGFVVVYPQALPNASGIASWNPALGGADVALFATILDQLEADLCIDTNRVFVTGLSQGGFMTSSIACVYADRVAAVAPVAGLRNPSGCSPSRPVPVLTFHGTLDTWVGYSPIPGIVAAWADRNGCVGEPEVELVGDDGTATVDLVAHPCPVDAPVSLYRITGGGHTWPGSEFSLAIESVVGYTTFLIDATDLAWEFFERHPLDGVTFFAEYTEDQCRAVDAYATALGITAADLVRHGVAGLRAVAEAGDAVPPPTPPATGLPCRIPVTWSADDAEALLAAAHEWGVDPDQLHSGGGALVVVLLYRAVRAGS